MKITVHGVGIDLLARAARGRHIARPARLIVASSSLERVEARDQQPMVSLDLGAAEAAWLEADQAGLVGSVRAADASSVRVGA